MPALDRYHEAARNALIKDGWSITNDPLSLPFGDTTLFADLGAERLIAAERGVEQIAVEVKTFLGLSPMVELERAIGQYGLYANILAQTEPERSMVLAIPRAAYEGLFARPVGQLALGTLLASRLCF